MKPINLAIEQIRSEDRLRKDLGDVADLADSLRSYGMIEPIIVTQDNRLVAGERRLRAATMLGWKDVPVVYREVLTNDELHELELEENVRRKDMTWQERCTSILVIHRIKVGNAAVAGQRWGQKHTAALLGMDGQSSVNYALQVGTLLEAGDKEILECESMMAAYRVIIRRVEDAATQALLARQVATQLPVKVGAVVSKSPSGADGGVIKQEVPLSRMFYNMDCRAYIKEMPPGSFSYIISDPPYAIDMSMLEQSSSGLVDTSGVAAEHNVDENLAMLAEAVPACCRLLRDPGWLILWTDQSIYQWLVDIVEGQPGMRVQKWPLTWVKTHICKNEQASKNFTKTTEIALVAAKGPATLMNPVPTCHWLGTNEEERKLYGHLFAKPHGMWKWIYDAVCMQGSVVFDPFVGRGSSAVAAVQCGLLPMGCEVQKLHFAHLNEHVKNAYKAARPTAEITFT